MPTFQYYIKQYGLQGNGAGALGATPFQLTLRVLGTSAASERNVWVKDYDTLADAKTGAITGTGYVVGGTTQNTTPATFTWADNASGSESLSNTFTLPF